MVLLHDLMLFCVDEKIIDLRWATNMMIVKS